MKVSKKGILGVLAGLGLAAVSGIAIAKNAKKDYTYDEVDTENEVLDEGDIVDVDYTEEE